MRRNKINIDVLLCLRVRTILYDVARLIIVSYVFAAVYFFELFFEPFPLSLFYLLQRPWIRPLLEAVVGLINVGCSER